MNVTGILAASITLAVAAAAPHAWLDAPRPAGWSYRVAMPAAPPYRLNGRIVPGGKDPELLPGGRCASTVRRARTAPERSVAARGWFIGRVVPPLPSSTSRGSWAVVMGISGADGMCRGLGYQLFAFRSGVYVGTLSGGERGRLHLAKTLLEGGNVLLLDEPSNDLDVETLRALEDALSEFAGTVMVISHDRWFLDRIATHIIAFEGDSQVVFFEGNYQDYEANKRARLGEEGARPHRLRYRPLTLP